MTLEELIMQRRAAFAAQIAERAQHRATIDDIRAVIDREHRDLSGAETARVRAAAAAIDRLDLELEPLRELERAASEEERVSALQSQVHPTGTTRASYDMVLRVGQEQRTYNPGNDKTGQAFLIDVARAALGDFGAREKLARHSQEAAVDGVRLERAVGTSAFSGLVVPQYLTDLYAPKARAGRPFADACRHHDLPATGMTADISRITTGTSVDIQSAENAAVSETDIDDTLLSVSVQTNAGSQTISRQALERGTGVVDVTLDDLFRAYSSKLDSTLINQATTGLSAVATSTSYTDSSPTAAELYPKLLQLTAAVEAALLDLTEGDVFVTMHSRRWYWLQAALVSTWPLLGQQGASSLLAGQAGPNKYGSGFRGVLPGGVPVVVDNNVSITKGSESTPDEDEIYFAAQSECHLWEDPNAPMLIRAEEPQAKKLGVDLVVYGYFAYTFGRQPHAQKIIGTGLETPTWTGS